MEREAASQVTTTQVFSKIGSIVDQIDQWICNIFSWGMLLMVFFVMYEVTARYVFNHPTMWAWDLNTQLFAIMAFIGGGYHLLRHYYVVVDVFVTRINKNRTRKIITDTISFIAGSLFLAALLWYGKDVAWQALDKMETSVTGSNLPIYPAKVSLAIGTFIMFLQWIVLYIREIAATAAGRQAVHLKQEGISVYEEKIS